jgi:hypothetical protein
MCVSARVYIQIVPVADRVTEPGPESEYNGYWDGFPVRTSGVVPPKDRQANSNHRPMGLAPCCSPSEASIHTLRTRAMRNVRAGDASARTSGVAVDTLASISPVRARARQAGPTFTCF